MNSQSSAHSAVIRRSWLQDEMTRDVRRSAVIAFGVVSFAAAIVTLWVLAHHSQEVLFNAWDARMYYGMVSDVAAGFKGSLTAGLGVIKRSLSSTHNGLYAVPIAFGFRYFGESWLSYQLLIVLIYQIPACVVIGLLGSALSLTHRLAIFCMTFTYCMILPAVWNPVLAYYPDVAALLALASMMVSYWVGRERLSLMTLFTTMCFAIVAILLRRHFVFPVASVFVSMAVNQVMIVLAESSTSEAKRKLRLRKMMIRGMKLLGCGIAVLGIMYLFAPQYTHQFFENKSAEYAGYRRDVFQVLQFNAKLTGAGTSLLAGLGYWLAYRTRLSRRSGVWFVVVFMMTWTVLWMLLASYRGVQYTLHAYPIFQAIGLGLGSVALFTSLNLPGRILSLSVLAFFLLRFILAPLAHSQTSIPYVFGSSLASNRTHAQDESAYRSLIQLLRSVSKNNRSIYVAAGSANMSDAVLKSVDESFPDSNAKRLHFVRAAQVDSRDWLPIPELIASDIIVVATPTQYHLEPDQQMVVNAVVQLMTTRNEFSNSYSKLSQSTVFSGGHFTVDVFVRNSPAVNAQTALFTLSYFVDLKKIMPGGQGPWVVLSRVSRQMGGPISNRSSWLYVETKKDSQVGPIQLVSTKKLSGSLTVNGGLRIGCSGSMKLSQITEKHVPTLVAQWPVHPTASSEYINFSKVIFSKSSRRFLLTIAATNNDMSDCNLFFQSLSIVQK